MNKNLEISSLVVGWLIVGLVMVYLQIIIGGITRLTGSGLSITDWDIVMGTFPPIGDNEWFEEFEKYKQTPQYQKINMGMKMGSIFETGTFKFIYFWEYLHRLWARLMGFAFLLPFIYFSFKKLIPKSLLRHFGIVISLAVLAALFGWIMVSSGLINRPWVNAYKLSFHLIIGISVLIALWWAFIRYINPNRKVFNLTRPHYLTTMLVLLVIQIFLGGVMSGTKAALFYNTWPDYNGNIFPTIIFSISNWNFENFNNYEQSEFLVSLVQFLHRSMAYLIIIYALLIFIKRSTWDKCRESYNSFIVFVLLLLLQVIVGILTLVNSVGIIPIYLGVFHQGLAVLLLSCFVLHLFYLSYLERRPTKI